MTKILVGVMGPGESARDQDVNHAYELGKRIAKEGWALLTGGGNLGVMEAVNKGAKETGGLTIGIMPSDQDPISEFIDVPIITNMGSARNNINILSCSVIIVCGMAAGTASEVALALKAGKKVILLGTGQHSIDFFREIGGHMVLTAESPDEVIKLAKRILQELDRWKDPETYPLVKD